MSLPPGDWRWANPQPDLTLLAEEDRDDARHFRFRAEAPGEVTIRFAGASASEVTVTVRIAPEQLA